MGAARRTFVEQGPDASVEEIAARAQMAASTLYRHFPTREALVEAVLDQLLEGTRDRAAQASQAADPGEAFRATLLEVCDLTGPEAAAFARLAGGSPRLEARAQALVAQVIGPAADRVRDAGRLRAGITTDDLVTFIRMVEGTPSTPGQRRTALEVLADGLVSPEPAAGSSGGPV